jgi:thioredoxin-like negative regulator of GroEL
MMLLSMNPLPATPGKSLLQHLHEDVPIDTLRLVTQTALLAVCSDYIDEANAISDGLQPSFGGYVAVAMAHATVASADGRSADALNLLTRLCARCPRVSALRCALAMLKKELDLPDWRSLAEEVAADNSDPQTRDAARGMLQSARMQ